MNWAWNELGYDLPCIVPCAENPAIAVVSESGVAQGEVRFADGLEADYICAREAVGEELEARNPYIKQLFELE